MLRHAALACQFVLLDSNEFREKKNSNICSQKRDGKEPGLTPFG